nr:MAG TPA: hypothetical protein [Caudoviricetes sp.]
MHKSFLIFSISDFVKSPYFWTWNVHGGRKWRKIKNLTSYPR